MSIRALHERQIETASMTAPETPSRGDASVGGRSYPQLPTAKVAASMVVITSGAQWGVLIGGPVLFGEPCQSETVITPTTCTQSTISTGTLQYVLWSDLNYFQEMFICSHLMLGLVERKKLDESMRELREKANQKSVRNE